MKKPEFLLATLFAVFAATGVFAQDVVVAEKDVVAEQTVAAENIAIAGGGGLERAGFSRLTIDGQEFSFRDAGKFVVDAETLAMLQKGFKREKIALGLGVYGAAVLCGGITISIIDSYKSRNAEEWGGLVTMIIGAPMIASGAVFGFVALGVGISGKKMTNRAIRNYNASGGLSELRLGMAATPGGLGLQLTF